METVSSSRIIKITNVLLFVSLIILYGCNGGFRVVEISTKAPPWLPGIEYKYKVVLSITFSDKVDINTISAPGTIRLDLKGTGDGRTALNIAGTFKFSDDQKTIVFISNETMSTIISPQAGENIEYTVNISGTAAGAGAVKNLSGEILDGNNDGKAGGDYKKIFEAIG